MRHLPAVVDPHVLVCAESTDDAAVYRVNDEQALVATLDYITPVVDDPYIFGAIAAANALSDVYAMGARPIFALNVVNFPRDALPLDCLGQIMKGGADKAAEAGAPILGGHSVDDPEPKYGLVAIGLVHPKQVVSNAGARPGDALVLTKPLGIGIITTALKRDAAAEATVRQAVDSMLTLNRAASEAMLVVGVNAATDVTGFGLLGHLAELLRASRIGALVEAGTIPLLPDVAKLAADGFVPGGTHRNLEALGDFVRWADDVDEVSRLILCDAQTSGGLLISLSPARCEQLLEELGQRGATGVVVGEVVEGDGISVKNGVSARLP
jgi:selenide,water dikinase